MKLSPRFYGPYRVLARVGSVAYRLELPPTTCIHSVFHVSQLKKKLGTLDRTVEELPSVSDNGAMELEPTRIIDFRWVK
jgi:hypothetical protein